MDAQALSALISAAAGLLGALIGFAGAQLTHKRTVDLAREQRRFERAQEMRAEVIPRIFAMFHNVDEMFTSLLAVPRHDTNSFRELVEELLEGLLEGRLNTEQVVAPIKEVESSRKAQRDAFRKQMKELKDYWVLHQIWLPRDLRRSFGELIDMYTVEVMKEIRAMNNYSIRTAGLLELMDSEVEGDTKAFHELAAQLLEAQNQALESFEAEVRETRAWLKGERIRREAAIQSAARKILAVED